MRPWEAIAVATGLTAIRVAVEHARAGGELEDTGGDVSRIIVAGAIAGFGFSIAERANPELTRGLASLIMITSILVNGIALADIARKVIQT